MTSLPSRGEVRWREMPGLDSVEAVSIGSLVERLGRLSDDRMRQVCAALAVTVNCSA